MKKIVLGGFVAIFALVASMGVESCSPASGNKPGHEYMPDMGHSIAYEANVYNEYSLHTWDKQSVKSRKELSANRQPVWGTIPRGYVGVANAKDPESLLAEMKGLGHGIATPLNGNVPYYYKDTEDERTRANKEIVGNPFPITKEGLARGKDLYIIYCGICHGEKGGGNGYLVRDDGKYPAQPANFLLDTFVNSNNGRFYHAIMYGKNVMGGYADKLSYEERWQVIHYIREQQAEAKKLEYSETANTFKPTSGTPKAAAKTTAPTTTPKVEKLTEAKKVEAKTEPKKEEKGK